MNPNTAYLRIRGGRCTFLQVRINLVTRHTSYLSSFEACKFYTQKCVQLPRFKSLESRRVSHTSLTLLNVSAPSRMHQSFQSSICWRASSVQGQADEQANASRFLLGTGVSHSCPPHFLAFGAIVNESPHDMLWQALIAFEGSGYNEGILTTTHILRLSLFQHSQNFSLFF